MPDRRLINHLQVNPEPRTARLDVQENRTAGDPVSLEVQCDSCGGLISIQTAQDSMQALATEWESLGLHVKQSSWPLSGLIAAFTANSGKNWQSMVQTAGSYDPASGVGVAFRFNSHSPFSGVHDTKLDTMLANAAGSTDLNTRCVYYNQAEAYIAKNYYGPFYFSLNPISITAKGIVGPGLTNAVPAVAVAPTIPWESVYYNPQTS